MIASLDCVLKPIEQMQSSGKFPTAKAWYARVSKVINGSFNNAWFVNSETIHLQHTTLFLEQYIPLL